MRGANLKQSVRLPSRAVPPAAFWAVTFALAYHLQPLFAGNQNHKFLHGLARAGFGSLDRDWLVTTADPTPLFSFLVYGTAKSIGHWGFYAEHLLLLVLYFSALTRLASGLAGGGHWGPASLSTFAFLTVFLHSHFLRELSHSVAGIDMRSALQDGLADQYVLGPYLQPSVFGVFLILSVAAFAEARPFRAAVLASVASSLAFTYFLSASTLVAAYSAITARRRPRAAAALAVLYLVICLPTLAYTVAQFRATSPGISGEARSLIARGRIPHHCQFHRWADGWAAAKVAWICLALYLVRRTALFAVLLTSLLAATALTVVQVSTGSDSLALLFPWRPTVFLVPISTAIITSKALQRCAQRPGEGPVHGRGPGRHAATLPVAFAFLATLLAIHGVSLTCERLSRQSTGEFAEMCEFVRGHREPWHTYSLPPVRYTHELQGFRLLTGAPVYVDEKSHPYRDAEVMEWSRRAETSRRIHDAVRDAGRHPAGGVFAEARANSITHMVYLAEELTHDDPYVIFRNSRYVILRVPGPS